LSLFIAVSGITIIYTLLFFLSILNRCPTSPRVPSATAVERMHGCHWTEHVSGVGAAKLPAQRSAQCTRQPLIAPFPLRRLPAVPLLPRSRSTRFLTPAHRSAVCSARSAPLSALHWRPVTWFTKRGHLVS